MIFINRKEAGRQLSAQLQNYGYSEDVIVLGIPRGGVPVAFEVASALHVPLDIFLSRKLGVPGQEELAFGAIAAGDGRFLDEAIIEAAGISADQVEQITRAAKVKLEDRVRLYRGARPPFRVEGKTVILVDDGIATGASIYAAIHALRQMKPKRLIVATPMAPRSVCDWLRPKVDELVVLYSPRDFYAVGQFYSRFSQVSDEEVVDLLRKAERLFEGDKVTQDCPQRDSPRVLRREISIIAGKTTLQGTLSLPKNPRGIVLFAHGSSSGRYSLRNRYVAEVLQTNGLATLLFDLLTREEESVGRCAAELRFNVTLLAKRLIEVTQWVAREPDIRNLPIGYFGASMGAAASLVAAAQFPDLIAAVVSRGGRPDLAAEALAGIGAPTLLIVGGLDEPTLSLNRQALGLLRCKTKQLVIIPGATHLFEEHGALEEVAHVAAQWFVHHLKWTESELQSLGPSSVEEVRS